MNPFGYAGTGNKQHLDGHGDLTLARERVTHVILVNRMNRECES